MRGRIQRERLSGRESKKAVKGSEGEQEKTHKSVAGRSERGIRRKKLESIECRDDSERGTRSLHTQTWGDRKKKKTRKTERGKKDMAEISSKDAGELSRKWWGAFRMWVPGEKRGEIQSKGAPWVKTVDRLLGEEGEARYRSV